MRLKISATVTLWVNRFIFVAVVAMVVSLPWLKDLYIQARPLDSNAQKAIFIAFYACTPVVLFALWNIEWLVRRILAGDVFISNNVRRISRLRWCCLLVSLICLPATFFYLPLLFMVVIMGFLGLVVSVVANVMAAAVEIREENDMTI
jgi:hypothetical protein